jgi:hypothetical protein
MRAVVYAQYSTDLQHVEQEKGVVVGWSRRPGKSLEMSRAGRNWSSLADLGFASIAGAPFIENRKVLRPDLADRRRNRHDVDVGRYAP